MPDSHATIIRRGAHEAETRPPLEIAATKAGLIRAMGYRIVQEPRLPSQKGQRGARRRPDPLEHIFDADAAVVPSLRTAPGLRAVAFYQKVLRGHP